MTNWFVYMVEQERRRDEIERAAARHAMNRIVHTDATIPPLRRHEIILAALGDRLVEWGHRLQTRYRRLALTTNTIASESTQAQRTDTARCA